MAIGYINTSNTFQQWLVATQSLITTANNLTDGGNSYIFYANTNLTVGNNLTVVGNTQINGDLTVTGNITLDAIGFDDLHVNGSIDVANTLIVTGATTLGTANITTANITNLVGTANTQLYSLLANADATALAFSIALG
jgi:hypothetical protein